MPQHTLRRQPLSCENCRKRKVKCEPKNQVVVPCATCIRRGYAQSCFFKRSEEKAQHASKESELLYRIRNLEDLLKQQLSRSSQSPSEPRIGSTPTMSDTASSYVGSDTVSARPRTLQAGTIITSKAGYQHFSPRASTLDANLLQELVGNDPGRTSASNFPFTSDPASARSTLLDTLPPLRQCDELKSVFFEVFSHVSQSDISECKVADIPTALPRPS